MQAMRPILMPPSVCTNQKREVAQSVISTFHFVCSEDSRTQSQSVIWPNALQAPFEVQMTDGTNQSPYNIEDQQPYSNSQG